MPTDMLTTEELLHETPEALNEEQSIKKTHTLTPELLRKINAYWRAANYEPIQPCVSCCVMKLVLGRSGVFSGISGAICTAVVQQKNRRLRSRSGVVTSLDGRPAAGSQSQTLLRTGVLGGLPRAERRAASLPLFESAAHEQPQEHIAAFGVEGL